MKLKWQLWFGPAAVLLCAAAFYVARQGNAPSRSDQLKAQYRAAGEKLTYSELGYPKPPLDSNRWNQAVAAMRRLPPAPWNNRLFDFFYVTPGHVRLPWKEDPFQFGTGQFEVLDWNDLSNRLAVVDDQWLRAYLRDPDLRYLHDPAGVTNWPSGDFVAQRTAAFWYSGHLLSSLHNGGVEAAWPDFEALVGLTRMQQEDPSLVNQMIRIAVLKLTLQSMWYMSQAEGWTPGRLAEARRRIADLDAYEKFETGAVACRAQSLVFFNRLRQGDPGAGSYIADSPVLQHISRWGIEPSEALILESMQATLDATRRVRTNAPHFEIARELLLQQEAFREKTSGALKLQTKLATIVMPQFHRAFTSVGVGETMRRMVLVALAIKEFEIRNGRLPALLDELSPLIHPVPLDPMSGAPFHYDATGECWTLYSVGEDGYDDGGDPTPADPKKQPSFWDGRDAVWPRPAEL